MNIAIKTLFEKFKGFLTDVSVFKKLLVTPAILIILIIFIALVSVFSIVCQKK